MFLSQNAPPTVSRPLDDKRLTIRTIVEMEGGDPHNDTSDEEGPSLESIEGPKDVPISTKIPQSLRGLYEDEKMKHRLGLGRPSHTNALPLRELAKMLHDRNFGVCMYL
jgi:hypothetical protein